MFRRQNVVCFDVHPNKPWLVAGCADSSFTVWDYSLNVVIYSGSVGEHEAEVAEATASRRHFEHSEGYQGPRTTDKVAEPGKDAKKPFNIKSIFFYDKTVRSTRALVQSNSYRLAPDAVNTVNVAKSSESLLQDWLNAIVFITDNHVMSLNYVTHEWRDIDMAAVLGKQVISFEYFAGSSMVAFGCSDGSVRLFDTDTWTPTRRLTGGHSKAVTRLVSYEHRGVSYLVSVGADFNIVIWNVFAEDEEALIDFTAAIKTSKEVFDVCLNYATGELVLLTNREIVVLDVVEGSLSARFPSKREFLRVLPFLHNGFPGNSLIALTSLQTSIMLLDASGKRKERQVLIEASHMNISHIQTFKCHPLSPNLIFMQSVNGIYIESLESHWIAPSFDLVEGKKIGNKDPPRRCVFASENAIVAVDVSVSTGNMGLSSTQKMVLPLESDDHVVMTISPSQKYMLLFWRIKHAYQLVRIRDKKIISSDSARGVSWSTVHDTDTFVILHTYTTNASIEFAKKRAEADRIAMQLAGDKKFSKKANKTGGLAANKQVLDVDKINLKVAKKIAKADKKAEKKRKKGHVVDEEKEDQVPRFSVKKVDDSRGEDLLAARSVAIKNVESVEPLTVFGGPLIGMTYHHRVKVADPPAGASGKVESPGATSTSTATTSSSSHSVRKKYFQFFSWECKKIHSPMPAPLDVKWDPTFTMCLFVYEHSSVVYTVRPTWKILCTLQERVYSSLWYNHSLFVSTSETIVCVFPSMDPVPKIVLSSSVSVTHFFSVMDVPDYRRMLVGPVALVDVVEDNLGILRWDKSDIIYIPLFSPQLKYFMLVQANLLDAALKWVPKIPVESMDELARFAIVRGHVKHALLLPISRLHKLSLCFAYALLDDVVPCLTSLLDKHTTDEEFGPRTLLGGSIVSLSTDFLEAQFAERSATGTLSNGVNLHKFAADIFSQLARVEPRLLSSVVLHAVAYGDSSYLESLVSSLKEAGQEHFCRYVVAALPPSVISQLKLADYPRTGEDLMKLWNSDVTLNNRFLPIPDVSIVEGPPTFNWNEWYVTKGVSVFAHEAINKETPPPALDAQGLSPAVQGLLQSIDQWQGIGTSAMESLDHVEADAPEGRKARSKSRRKSHKSIRSTFGVKMSGASPVAASSDGQEADIESTLSSDSGHESLASVSAPVPMKLNDPVLSSSSQSPPSQVSAEVPSLSE